jgi:hypothetical protein
MTGPEHYRQAERALHIATQANDVAAALHIAAAQAHAILALAAATALNDGNGGTTVTDYRAWKAAASAETPETPLNGLPDAHVQDITDTV